MLKGFEPSPELIARFWAKVNIGDGCWLWTASTIKGYGQFRLPRVDGKQCSPLYAHRVAWELTNGPIPTGQNVCHHCDTPLCCNPGHLFLGTQQENLADARRKGRLDESRPRRLTDDDYLSILTSGRTNGELALAYGVHEISISRIRNGRQGVKAAERILQDQSRQPEARLSAADLIHQVLEPVPFRELPVVGEVG